MKEPPKLHSVDNTKPNPPRKPTPLETILTIEGEAFAAKDHLSLKHLAVNQPRQLLPVGHIIWVNRRGYSICLDAISSQAQVDKTTPFAQWMTLELAKRAKRNELDQSSSWQFDSSGRNDTFAYPFSHAHYTPFSPNPERGGLLFTRDTPFSDTEIPLISRVSQVYGITSKALGQKKRARMSVKKRTVFLSTIAALALAAFIPVPMTTLAPAEIVADTPFVVTAPIDGVVETILVPPNSEVTIDTPLIQLVDTSFRNEYVLAGQEQAVSNAKLRQASLTAFIDGAAKGEIAVAQAEIDMAIAKQDYARERLGKTILNAPKDGLAIYSDPTDWTGRPVSTGEAIIQIADPSRVLLKIDVPLAVGDSLEPNARIRMFMDSDPLKPIEAKLLRASYYAEPTPEGTMAYEAFGDLETNETLPRIGSRGVAKIYGGTAPLGFWLLRRPITITRQFFGV